ncbi:MAG: protease family protein, partial [Bacteroidota bacterium]|nr:protease family protein [Bacteroidota bacterium]
MKKTYIGILIAAALWFFMFSPWTAGALNFWGAMLAATGILTCYSIFSEKSAIKEIFSYKHSYLLAGLISAAVLYLIFMAGNAVSKLLFDFAEGQVSGIYLKKSQASQILIGLALLFWIGPAEEFFWRGFVQHNFTKKFGGFKSIFITTLLYTLVHVWSFNFMLLGAAAVCGLFWSYMFYRY